MRGTRWLAAVMVSAVLSAAPVAGTGAHASSGTADQAVAYQINVTHTGDLSGDTLVPPLQRVWSHDLGGNVSYPLIAGGEVFVTAASTAIVNGVSHNATTLYALDEKTGNTLWTTGPVPSTFSWSGLAYDAGRVFMLTYDGGLAAFDAGSGASLWSVALSGQRAFTSPPVAANGTVYTAGAGSGGTLYAVDETTGTVKWTDPVLNGDDSSPALSSSNVYVSYVGPQTYSFNLDGTTAWHFQGSSEGGGGDTPVLAGGRLFTRSWASSPNGYVFDASAGTVLGRFSAGPAPAFSGNVGAFLAGGSLTSGNTLSAQDWTDPANVKSLWSFTGDGTLDTAPIIVNDDVFVGSANGNLYALNLSTGNQVWSDNVGSPILAPNDNYVGQPYPGMAAGEGTLVVPASNAVVAYQTSPSFNGSAISAIEGASFSEQVATFTTTNAGAAGDAVTISWGDGSSSAGSVSQASSGAFVVNGTHTYAEEGSYTVTVSIPEPAGSTTTVTDQATVTDAALASVGYPLGTVRAGSSFTARLATVQDADPGCAGGDYTATVNWGDGSTSAATLAPGSTACSFDVTGSHTYAVAAGYTITVTVNDAGGSSTVASDAVTVAVPPSTSKTSVSAQNSSNPYVKLNAQSRNGSVSGSLQYDDPNATAPSTAISGSIVALVKTGSNTETAYGSGTQNGRSVSFTVSVLGNQPSGSNTIHIQTSTGYDSGTRSIASAKVS